MADDGSNGWLTFGAVETAVAAGCRVDVATPACGLAGALPAESRVQLLRRLRGTEVAVHTLTSLSGPAPGRATVQSVIRGHKATWPRGERPPRPSWLDQNWDLTVGAMHLKASGFFIRLATELISAPTRPLALRRQVRYSFLVMRANGEQLRKIAALVDAGVITPVVDRVFPFQSTNEAMHHVASGRAKGKVVVTMGCERDADRGLHSPLVVGRHLLSEVRQV